MGSVTLREKRVERVYAVKSSHEEVAGFKTDVTRHVALRGHQKCDRIPKG